MVDKSKPVNKKESTKKVEKISKKESKKEAFLRIAETRVRKVLYRLRLLGNCSNRSNYEYTKEQVGNIYASISKGLETMFAKFIPSKLEQESFKF